VVEVHLKSFQWTSVEDFTEQEMLDSFDDNLKADLCDLFLAVLFQIAFSC